MKRFLCIILWLLGTYPVVRSQEIQLSPEGAGYWQEALAALDEAGIKGEHYLMAGRFFERVLVSDPGVSEVYYNLGLIYSKYAFLRNDQGGFYRALRYFRRFLDMEPNDAEVHAEVVRLSSCWEKIKKNWVRQEHKHYVYEGEMKDEYTQEGWGIMAWEDGQKYEGEWKGGMPSGGVMTWKDGSRFEGTYRRNSSYWKNIAQSWKDGVMIWPNGDCYEGHWGETCCKKGLGTFIIGSKDGDRYISNCPGCKKYIGEWIKDVKQGNGTCYDADGRILYQGKFKDDKPVGAYPARK